MFTTNWHGDISTPNHEKYRHCEERSDAAIHGFGGKDCHATLAMTMLFHGNQPSHQRQRGFTLIELIIFIVVVSIGLAGILSVMNTVVKSSADPMVRKQAMALADSIMEEILLKSYTSAVTGTDRASYDSVGDYNGKSNALFTDLPDDLATYLIGIAVADDTTTLGTTPNIPAKKVTVTITHGTDVVRMIGYRTNY